MKGKVRNLLELHDNGYNYMLTLVIRSINLNKYDVICLNNVFILSIYKEDGDNLNMKYIVNNFIKNGDIKLENVPRWGNQILTYGFNGPFR